MRTVSKPPGKAMYVASQSDKDWIRNAQRALYERSREDPSYVFCKLWGFVTDLRNLRVALARVASNRGRRTAGVDGVTVGRVLTDGVDAFVEEVRTDMRSGAYRPSPVRRVLIPKPGQPGKTRALGIPTVKDRVVQAAVKNILEPIFEADFYPSSYGFRPGKSVHGALELLRLLLRPRAVRSNAERRLPYQWAIEGDIKGCFDHIDHHVLMVRVRRRVGDPKVARLVVAFLKAGIMTEEQLLRSDAGTPQGGILSPLLANIALGMIEERYARHAAPCRTVGAVERARAYSARATDRARGVPVFYPVRYADDFIILVSVKPGPDQSERAQAIAMKEKAELALYLKEQLGLELSETKTLVTPVTEPMAFLGHRIRVRRHPDHGRMVCTAVIPKERSQDLRRRIKALFHISTVGMSLAEQLRRLNPVLRGWSHFYRHAWGAKRILGGMDRHAWWAIKRWLKKKHRGVPMGIIKRRYGMPRVRRTPEVHGWSEDGKALYRMASVKVEPYRLAWERPPDFAANITESRVHSERCTPGSGRGGRKPPA